MEYLKLEELTNHNIQERHIRKLYPEFYNFINDSFSNIKWLEKLYCFYHNLPEPPKCPVCDKNLKLISFFEGYHHYCSKKCMYNDPKRAEKIVNTQRERYGGVGFESKELMNKTKKTNIERYGVENNFLLKGVQDHYRKLKIQRYGDPYYNNREKAKQTMLDKYGVINTSLLYSGTIIDYTPNEKHEYKRKCPHPECNKCQEKFYWADSFDYSKRRSDNFEPCTRLMKNEDLYGKSYSKNTTIELFVHRILNEYNIEYEKNNRSILKGKELDIYIPSKHLAIECNGVYWHSIECKSPKDKFYHFNKWKECKDNGIELITIWDYQIYENPDWVKDVIEKKIGIKNHINTFVGDEYIANNDVDFIPDELIFDHYIDPGLHTINDMSYYDSGKSVYIKR